MEDLDDEVVVPDSLGAMHLSHRGWNEIPKQLLHNSKYTLLELDLSYNSISTLTDTIGLCIKLRRLNLSNNHLAFLPDTLSQCQQLEILCCADNKIQSIPLSFGSLQCLISLDVRNNCLQDVPDRLSQIPCITSILCSGNSFSFEIPDEYTSSGHMFLWYLKQRHDINMKFIRAMDECNQIEHMCQRQEFSLLQVEESINQLTNQVEILGKSRPIKYLEFKQNMNSMFDDYLQYIRHFGRGVGLAFRSGRS